MIKLLMRLAALVMVIGVFATQAISAFACGGLIAPDGDVQLSKATTLVAWHDGIEHYMTSFTFQGEAANVGWIVPLPAVPLKIEAGGAWSLQRLLREFPAPPLPPGVVLSSGPTTTAQVLQQVQIEALNITVIRGSGDEVLNWATANAFLLDAETRAHLLTYAKGSPIFMAAKYDLSAARARHQSVGDGAPVLITMKTTHPWIPLEVLAVGGQQVQADLLLLTDMPVNVSDFNLKFSQSSVGQDIPGTTGFRVVFQEQIDDVLYHDLSTDRNMNWVQRNSWYTYLTLSAPDAAVTYDMGISPSGVIRVAPYGTAPMAVVDAQTSKEFPSWLPTFPVGALPAMAALAGVLLLGIGGVVFLRRRGALKVGA